MKSSGLFEGLLETSTIFKNREYLRPSYVPDELPHRDEQIQQLAQILVAPLRGETPSNVLIYGKTGTGKTACVKYVKKELESIAYRAPQGIEVVYLNCEVINTQYRILASLTNLFLDKIRERHENYGSASGFPERVPMTGWPTDEVYRFFLRALEHEKQFAVVVLDEIDKLVSRGCEDVLYKLTRVNSDLMNARVSIVGISNDLNFLGYLDPRIQSSLGGEELVFPPYNALQLKDILERRAELSFLDGAIGDGVISLCAAHAARENGDARKALDLLRVAGEVAEREGAEKVEESHVKKAYEKIEQDRAIEVVRSLPTQSKLVLCSVVLLSEMGSNKIITGDVYNVYCTLSRHNGLDVLTRRRVSDLISELDMLGILNVQLISEGRYGRTKRITLNIPPAQAMAAVRDYPICDIELPVLRRSIPG